jgi:hypothetical protein
MLFIVLILSSLKQLSRFYNEIASTNFAAMADKLCIMRGTLNLCLSTLDSQKPLSKETFGRDVILSTLTLAEIIHVSDVTDATRYT